MNHVTSATLPKAGIATVLALSFFTDTLFASSALRFGAVFVVVVVLLVYTTRRSYRLFNSAPMVLWALFYLYSLLNNNRSIVEGDGFQWIVCFGGILAMMILLEDSRDASLCLFPYKCILFFSMIHAAITIVCFLFPTVYDSLIHPIFFSDITSVSREGYKSGFTSHYSTNGIYLATGLLASLPFVVRQRDNKKYIVCCAALLIALLLTTKRAHLVFGVCAFLFGYLLFNSRKLTPTVGRTLVVSAIAALMLFAVSQSVPELTQVFNRISIGLDDDTFGGRASFYSLCIDMWEDSPLLGSGMGSYTETFNQTSLGIQYIANGYREMKAHNVFLQVLAEGGIVGIILFMGALVGSLAMVTKALLSANRYNPGDALERSVLAASCSMQAFFLVYCVTGNPLYTFQSFATYLLCVGSGLSMIRCRALTSPCPQPLRGVPSKNPQERGEEYAW